jgi:hypothetical protein
MAIRLKSLTMEWEKISDKGLIIRKCKKLIKLNSQRITYRMKRWAEELNRTFSKEEVQMAKKAHEEMFYILGHKENANQSHI